MKKLLFFCVLCGAARSALRAQSISAMTEQLTVLWELGQTTQDGYRLVRNGLQGIGEIREGEYGLHSDYFGSLSLVKPALMNDRRVKVLQGLQAQLIGEIDQALVYWRKQPFVQP